MKHADYVRHQDELHRTEFDDEPTPAELSEWRKERLAAENRERMRQDSEEHDPMLRGTALDNRCFSDGWST